MQFYSKKRKPPVINIISLIDIFCILLIFSLVTTTFKKNEPMVQIELPDSNTAKVVPQKTTDPVVITATKDLKLTIAGQPIEVAELAAKLKELKPQTPQGFILKADTGVPLGFFVKLFDAATEAGIPNLNLQTQDPKASGTP